MWSVSQSVVSLNSQILDDLELSETFVILKKGWVLLKTGWKLKKILKRTSMKIL